MKPWLGALAASLLVHAALLSQVAAEPAPSGRQSPPKEDGWLVTFAAVQLAMPLSPKRVEQPAVDRKAPVSFPLRHLGSRRAASAEHAPLPSRGDSSAMPPSAPEVPASSSEEPAVPASGLGLPSGEGSESTLGASSATAPKASGSPGSADSAGTSGSQLVALIHARLAAVADACYPRASRRFGQRGTVQLSFCTDARGSPTSTRIVQSSGAELLDAAARGCLVESAAPFPLEAASRCFTVPVRFGLGGG